MKALLLSQYNQLDIADVPAPVPGADEILVRVAACGICGSDVHGYDGTSGRRIPPLVMGHEAAGVVAAVGNGVTTFKPGDRVTFDSTVYCGQCEFCLQGEINLCNNRQVIGVSCGDYRRAGAFAEFVVVPQRIAYHLPDALEFQEAAMLEAIFDGAALHAVRISEMKGGETALVIGAGMIGFVQYLPGGEKKPEELPGCWWPISIARVCRPPKASAPTETLLLSGSELVKEILKQTEGRGVDLVLEAVGREETIAASIASVRKGGTVTLIGNISPEVKIPLQAVVSRQIRLQGSCASSGEYPQAMELLASGKIQVKSLITAVAPLSDGPRWFARLHAGEPNLMKVVLDPGA